MKRIILSLAVVFVAEALMAQKYPDPEFANEIYYYKKDSSMLVRLEKGNSKMDTKLKMAGWGGSETAYELDGEKSPVRLNSGNNLSFIFSNGAATASSGNARRDSMMRANGVDPTMMQGMSEPSNMISLYKADGTKDKRKIYLQKSGGMFSANKNQSSPKYTFSVKKIKEGYWELVIDKSLPKGEYIFTMTNMGMGNMDGSMLLYAFAVD